MSNDKQLIQKVRDDLNNLATVIENLAYAEPPKLELKNRELSGDHITGGQITRFSSTGIKDTATRLSVYVNDDGIITDFIDVDTLVGDTKVEGNLHVGGEITASKLHVNELTADVRNERTSPLEFIADEKNGIYGKGIQWKGIDHTRQLVYRSNPDRIFSTDSIDLFRDKEFCIDNVSVLNSTELGRTVTKSNIQELGALRNLTVQGSVNIDDFIHYDSGSMRFSVGSEEPNGMFSLASLESEFVIDPEGEAVKLGTWTNSDINIITDDTVRISVTKTGHIHLGPKGLNSTTVSVNGKLGVNINNVSQDVDIETAGSVRFQNKKFEVGTSEPKKGNYKTGDIVWNDNPKPTGYVGWVCIKEGTPGLWKPFGQIGS